jgi:hypothetical protein
MSRLASFMILSAAFGLLLVGGCGGESEKPKPQPPAAQPAQPGGQPTAPDQTSAPATQPKPPASS